MGMHWAIDMDGVLWRGEEPVPGAQEALRKLRASGSKVTFATNNSTNNSQGFVDKLASMGFEASPEEILHTGFSVARMIRPGERVLNCALHGVTEGLNRAGADWVSADDVDPMNPGEFDSVVVTHYEGQTLERLAIAMRAVHSGARLLAPSSDPLFPGHDGLYFGTGSLIAAIAYATGVEPVLVGKPYPPMTELVRDYCGDVSGMIGDQMTSDGGLARSLDVDFYWVQTGVRRDPGIEVGSTSAKVHKVRDFAEAVERIIAAA